MVAPVAIARFDEMGREDLAGAQIDDRDLPLVDDGEDAAASMGRADLEVVHAAAAPQGHGALAVGDVVGEAEGVEWRLESGEAARCGPLAEVALEGLLEPLDLALGLRVTWRAVLLADAKVGEQVLEAVAAP